MKIQFVLFFLVVLILPLKSQNIESIKNNEVSNYLTDHSMASISGFFKATSLGGVACGNVGFNYEWKIKNPFSIKMGIGLAPVNRDLYVPFYLDFRYYYNLKKRMQKGKTGNNFYADYIAVGMQNDFFMRSRNKIFLDQIYFDDYTGLTLTWGIQRPIGNSFYWELNASYINAPTDWLSHIGGMVAIGADLNKLFKNKK